MILYWIYGASERTHDEKGRRSIVRFWVLYSQATSMVLHDVRYIAAHTTILAQRQVGEEPQISFLGGGLCDHDHVAMAKGRRKKESEHHHCKAIYRQRRGSVTKTIYTVSTVYCRICGVAVILYMAVPTRHIRMRNDRNILRKTDNS